MKTLVLVFHPHLEKSQVNRKLMDAANETGDVTVMDEYAAYPDFKINVEHEQELIETHDRIVLQFPFYWYSSPALLKQWEDDVIKAGWAYGGGRALEGKEFMLAVVVARRGISGRGKRRHEKRSMGTDGRRADI